VRAVGREEKFRDGHHIWPQDGEHSETASELRGIEALSSLATTFMRYEAPGGCAEEFQTKKSGEMPDASVTG